MALPWEVISENILNVASILDDLLNTSVSKDVDWITVNPDGTVDIKKVPNLAKIMQKMKQGTLLAGHGEPGQDLEINGPGTLYVDIDTRKVYVVTDVKENDDGSLSTTWELIDADFMKYVTETPKIEGPTVVVETTTEKYNISNFDPNAVYKIDAIVGEIDYKVGDDYFTYTTPSYAASTTDRIIVVASVENKLPSIPAFINITVKEIPEEDDQQIVDNDTSSNTSESDGVE